MWFACVAIGAVATSVIILSLWEKFQTNPTITGLDTDFHNWDVPFPAITVCQEVPANYDDIESYIMSQNSILKSSADVNISVDFLTKLTQLSFETLKDFAEFYEQNKLELEGIVPEDADLRDLVYGLMNMCQYIFDTCTLKDTSFDCCNMIFPVFTENGFCYTFNSRHYEKTLPGNHSELPQFKMHYIKETDIQWSMKFTIKDLPPSFQIFILNSDEQAGIDVEPQHVWDFKVDAISFSVKQTYTTADTEQLSIKQRHCVFPHEEKLKIDHIYTYTACTRQCRMDNAMRLCNCVPHFYPSIGQYVHCKLNELGCIKANLDAIMVVDRCSCHLGCSNTVYEVEKLHEGDNKIRAELESKFVSWPMVRYKREVLFGWVDLLVSFGGIAGLFLGFSLLSGVEILYYFTVRACCMVVRERRELETIRREEASKPPLDYNLSLVPSFLQDPYPGNGLNEVAKGYYNENLRNHTKKIAPVNMTKVKPTDKILPPFGIEFLN